MHAITRMIESRGGSCMRPIPHHLHAAGKRKIRRQLEEPRIVLFCTSVNAADMAQMLPTFTGPNEAMAGMKEIDRSRIMFVGH
jgi:hypothetical protein